MLPIVNFDLLSDTLMLLLQVSVSVARKDAQPRSVHTVSKATALLAFNFKDK